jgi:hypothetical protein
MIESHNLFKTKDAKLNNGEEQKGVFYLTNERSFMTSWQQPAPATPMPAQC